MPQSHLSRLNLSSNNNITDAGIKEIGARFSGSIVELCIYGCYLLTNRGVVGIASTRLARLNYCGCYKVGGDGRHGRGAERERARAWVRKRENVSARVCVCMREREREER
jgi:hypothetical protein